MEIQHVTSSVLKKREETGVAVPSNRLSFMLDMIYDLKNNRKRGNVEVEYERSKQMKKFVQSVRSRASSSSDSALRIEWDELIRSDKSGRWWVVGAPWIQREGNGTEAANADDDFVGASQSVAMQAATNAANDGLIEEKLLSKLMKLAKKYRMNTVSMHERILKSDAVVVHSYLILLCFLLCIGCTKEHILYHYEWDGLFRCV